MQRQGEGGDKGQTRTEVREQQHEAEERTRQQTGAASPPHRSPAESATWLGVYCCCGDAGAADGALGA